MQRADIKKEMDNVTCLASTADGKSDEINQQIDQSKKKIEAEDENINHSVIGISDASLENCRDQKDNEKP